MIQSVILSKFEYLKLGIYSNIFHDTKLFQICRYSMSNQRINNYENAIEILNKLQLTSLNTKLKQYPNNQLSKYIQYFPKCGIKIEDIENNLSVIHIAGTKGKGSTCAFSESILRHHGYKTGLFTSPHLVSVRERIQINGKLLSREKFASYLLDTYYKLQNDQAIARGELPMLTYFAFITLMAFKIFLVEKVDVAILEVGVGGEYDNTNILNNTSVVGISSIGFDHTQILGNTLEEIAWQKSGILKQKCVAIVSNEQPLEVLEVIRQRAMEKKCIVFESPQLSEYEFNEDIILGIDGPVQYLNASLALQVTNAWMNLTHYSGLGEVGKIQKAPIINITQKMIKSLKSCHWPGRSQTLKYSAKLTFYLDGAHNTDSILCTKNWFSNLLTDTCQRVLIFNITGQRNAKELLNILIPCNFNLAIFCTNKIKETNGDSDCFSDNWVPPERNDAEYKTMKQNFKFWLELNPSLEEENTMMFSNLTDVVHFLEKLSRKCCLKVLVTGSLHLVGGFLSIIDPEMMEH